MSRRKITVPLKALGAYINGRAFKPADCGSVGLPIVRIANIKNPRAPIDYYSGEVKEAHRIDTGDILVSWSASLDAFQWDRGVAVLNQHIFKVVPNKDVVDENYLFFVLKFAMIGLQDLVHGATMKHVRRPVFEDFEVHIEEDKAKQRELAASLTAQFDEIEIARQAVEAQLKDLDTLPECILSQAFAN